MEFRVQIVSKQVERRGEGGSHVYSRPGYLQRMSGAGTYNMHDVTYPTESKTSRGYLFVGHAPANEKEKETLLLCELWHSSRRFRETYDGYDMSDLCEGEGRGS